MDCLLPGYRLSKEKYKELWDNCYFVIDTNVLFNIYRYSPELREALIDILTKISERLWIPYQVALEYYDNRASVISTEISKYNIITNIISKYPKNIKDEIQNKDLYRKHTVAREIAIKIGDKLDESFKEIRKDLQEIVQECPRREDLENINDTINKLFIGKVGEPYSIEELEQICKDGSTRYDLMLPPGYEDGKDKKGIKKYSDLILWFQIIDMAKERKRPVVFICEDLKGDWWWKPSDTPLGPRPELVQEFTSKTNELFFMYSLDRFMEYAHEYIDIEVKDDIIEEAKEYRADEERRLKEIELEELSKKLSSIGEDLRKNSYSPSGLASAFSQQSEFAGAAAAIGNSLSSCAGVASTLDLQPQTSKLAEMFYKPPDFSVGFASIFGQQSQISKIAEVFSKPSDSFIGIASALDQQSQISKIAEGIYKPPDFSAGFVSALGQQVDRLGFIETLGKGYRIGEERRIGEFDNLLKRLDQIDETLRRLAYPSILKETKAKKE